MTFPRKSSQAQAQCSTTHNPTNSQRTMSKRFEKASLGKDADPVNPSFKAFQAQVEEQARLSALERQRAHLAAAAAATEKDKVSTSTSTSAVNKGIEELSIEPEAEAEEDRRSLEVGRHSIFGSSYQRTGLNMETRE